MRFYSVRIDRDALESYAQTLGFTDQAEALHALANNLASQLPVAGHPQARLVARAIPQAVIGIWGDFEKDQESELEIQAGNLNRALPRVFYVNYQQAEEACIQLAARLIEHFGKNEIAQFQFRAIPRGGFFVLGMLSYLLGLKPGQLQKSTSADSPLVLVDDCAFTGGRFGVALGQETSGRVVFAHLYSHPFLRKAIEKEEKKVIACIAADDLETVRDTDLEGNETWQQRLRQLEGKRYWAGETQFVCFAWNEPDRALWNPTTSKMIKGWQLVPAELCLKNRERFDLPAIPVQIQRVGKGPLHPSPNVIYHQADEEVLLGNLESGESASLSGTGASFWKAIVEQGEMEAIVNQLVGTYEVEQTQLRDDLRRFVDELHSRGFLEKADNPAE